MKRFSLIALCVSALLSINSHAEDNKVIGSGTITFVGAIVEGNCQTETVKNVFKTSCWSGSEMQEQDYNLEPHKAFSKDLGNNKGKLNIKWIDDHLAIMDIAYN